MEFEWGGMLFVNYVLDMCWSALDVKLGLNAYK